MEYLESALEMLVFDILTIQKQVLWPECSSHVTCFGRIIQLAMAEIST